MGVIYTENLVIKSKNSHLFQGLNNVTRDRLHGTFG